MQAPMTIQRGEAFYRQLVETIDDVVYVVDGDGCVVYASPAISPLLGYSPEEAVGRHFRDFVHADDLPRAQRVFETRLVGEQTEDEYRVVTRWGQVCWVHSTVRLIQTGDGSPGLCGVLVDITEQHRMQEDLSLKDKAIASSVSAIAIADLEGRLTYVNPAFLEMWGYASEAEVLGRPAVSFWQAKAKAAQVVRALQQDGRWIGELAAQRKDGARLDVQLAASLFTGRSGEPVGMMASFVDVTQRKRTEEQIRASLREKEVLLQEVHHRVKNNLQIISSLLDIQSQGVAEPRARQVLQDSRNRIRAMAFVHDRLYQARDLARIDLDDYIRSVVSYLHGVYGSLVQNIALHLQIEQVPLDLDTAIPCGLIINELVSNALKYAFPPDASSGDVWIEFGVQPDGQLLLAVRDNGSGLSPDIDLDTTPSLGLQLVRMLSEQIRGTVHLSREGGTAFTIVFPGPARGVKHAAG